MSFGTPLPIMFLIALVSLFFISSDALPIFKRDTPSVSSSLDTYAPRRSTYDIVRACVMTTFLCAWVSIHPNARHQLPTTWEKVGQRIRLLLLTVIAPEFVIGWAWMERIAAKRIKKQFKEKGFDISMAYAHLIHMRGFALCFPELTEQEMLRVTIGAEHGNLVDHPRDDRNEAMDGGTNAQTNVIKHDDSNRDQERDESMDVQVIRQLARSDPGEYPQRCTEASTVDRNTTTHSHTLEHIPTNTDTEKNLQEVLHPRDDRKEATDDRAGGPDVPTDQERDGTMNMQVGRRDPGENPQRPTEMSRNITTHGHTLERIPTNAETVKHSQEILVNAYSNDEYINIRYIETLSADRFLELLGKSSVAFPNISKCELEGRSKTDGLGRLITAIQAFWFILQCIVRAQQKLVITELEITTLALASLNVYLLWLWRDKPQHVGVQLPVYLRQGSEVWEGHQGKWEEYKSGLEELKARSEAGIRQKDVDARLPSWRRWLLIVGRGPVKFWRHFTAAENWKNLWLGFVGRNRESRPSDQESESRRSQLVPILRFIWNPEESSMLRLIAEVRSGRRRGWRNIVLMFLMSLIFDILLFLVDLNLFLYFVIGFPLLLLLFRSHRVSNIVVEYFDTPGNQAIRKDVRTYASQAVVVGILFCGLHFSAIGATFPTKIEYYLWMVSSMILTCYVTFWLTPFLFPTSVAGFYGSPISAFIFLCILARFCIIVLVMTTLREQPVAAYLVVSWTKLFPHASS